MHLFCFFFLSEQNVSALILSEAHALTVKQLKERTSIISKLEEPKAKILDVKRFTPCIRSTWAQLNH